MHIAFITSEYPHEKSSSAGGIGTSIKNLAEAIVKTGNKATIFIYGQNSQENFIENGVSIYLIESKEYYFFKWYFYRKLIQNFITKIIKLENIDVIEAPDWTGITAFMKFKIPLVIRFHGSDAYFCKLENRKQKLKNYFFEKLAINNANAFVSPTDYASSQTKQLFKIKNKPIKTIFYGLELSNFINETPQIFEKYTILYIGTIIRKKGVLELPFIFKEVLKSHPYSKLILVGSDASDVTTNSSSTWELLKNNLTHDEQKRVFYLGKVSYEKVQNHIKNANVCIFPSFAETLGMVTIESMAMSKAVVNTDIGWAQELLVDTESGFLVYPKNHKMYAQKIISIFDNESATLQMAKNARNHVEQHFDIDKIVLENLKFYNNLI